MLKLITAAKLKLDDFRKMQEGVALTEYIVLLGLLVAGVIIAVGIFGSNLSSVWTAWGTWMSNRAAEVSGLS